MKKNKLGKKEEKKEGKKNNTEKKMPLLPLEPVKILPLMELRFPGESDEENDYADPVVVQVQKPIVLQKPVASSNNKPAASKPNHRNSGNKLVAGSHGKSKHPHPHQTEEKRNIVPIN